MKKKITAILSFLLALVMCFALVACGNNTPSNGDKPNGDKPNGDKPGDTAEKTLTYGKLAESLELITSGEGGYKATVSYGVNTKNDKTGATGTLELEKRGRAVAVKLDDNNYIANLDNGYVYSADKDGKYTVKQLLAGGMLDYALAAYDGGEADYDKLAEVKGYDKTTKKLVYKYDIKDKVNSVVEPLIDGYANKGTLYALVNTYLDKFYLEGVTVEDMLDTGAKMLVLFKDETVASLFEDGGTSITDILVGAGIEVNEDFVEIIEKRTLGEALSGAFEFLDGMLAGGLDGFNAEELLYCVLEKEYTDVTAESLTASVDKYGEMIIALLKGYTVKDVVDMLATPIEGIPAEVTNTLYTIVTEGVKLTNAEINFELTFDDEYRVTKLIAKADCAHNYAKTTELMLLSDNDYHAEATLDISDYAATTNDFDIEFAENASIGNTVTYVADGSADAKIYIELAGKTATLNFTQVAAAEREQSEAGISYKVTGTPVDAAAYVSYDAATTTLTVKKAFFDELKKGEGFGGAAAVVGTLTADGKQEAFTVYIDGITDDPAGLLQEIIKAQLETIMGSIGNQPAPPETSQAA